MKTRIGIPVPLLGVAVYLLALVGGWVPTVLLAGYILLFEADNWLKASAAKAIVIMVFFALLSVFIGFIPNIITLIDQVANLFNGNFSIVIVTRIVTLMNTILNIAQRVILIIFAFLALGKKTITLGLLDKIFEETSAEEEN